MSVGAKVVALITCVCVTGGIIHFVYSQDGSPATVRTVQSGPKADNAVQVTKDKIEIDGSSPKAVANSYVTLMAAMESHRIPDLLVPEQQENGRRIFPVADLWQELSNVLDDKFPDSNMRHQLVTRRVGETKLRLAGLNQNSDTEAVATLQSTRTSFQTTLTIKLIDNYWRIHDPYVAGYPANPPANLTEYMDKVPIALRNLIARLRNGEFADETVFNRELEKTMSTLNELLK